MRLLLVLCAVFQTVYMAQLKFPDDFEFGVATASYQIEGAWNESGKGENIWDRLTHEHPDWITDNSNGDIACDSYHKVKEDVQILRDLGVNFYRLSLSWSRLLPSGYANHINPDGIRYYNEVIDELLKYNITPMVTLYHWDLPQPLQEIGGWPNPLLADYFEDYAKVAFESFGDRVKIWITFNEPPEICQSGYAEGGKAPAYHSDGIGDYLCGRTLLISHARAYHLYDRVFRNRQQGKVGITINSNWFEPESNSTNDIEAAQRAQRMSLGWWANPIFSKDGDYPAIMKQRISKMSHQEGFPRSRLIPFTAEEIKLIQGTHDFFGLNHYSTSMAAAKKDEDTSYTPSYKKDVGVNTYSDPSWPSSAAPWLKVVPWGFRKLLNWIKTEYDNPEVYITENGFADTGELNDLGRVNYYKLYLNALLEAIHLDGCNVKGYAAWSVFDNFEWREGYTQHFGIYKVDFNDPNRKRTPKASVGVYKQIIKTRVIDDSPSVNLVN